MLRKPLLTVVLLWVSLLCLIPSSSALLFDFASPKQLNRWEVLNDVDGQWEVSEGTLKFTSSSKWNLLAIRDFEFTDGTIEYKLKWLEGGICEVGVFYRLQESPNFQHYHVHISAIDVPPRGVEWRYVIQIRKNGLIGGGQINTPVFGWNKDAKDRWFTFKIEVNDDEHVVYAGSEGKLERVIQFNDSALQSGKVGLLSLSPVTEIVLIDDFKVISALSVRLKKTLTTTWGEIKTNR